jgi:protein TonB
MSYANKRQMSTNRTPAIIVVALIHLALGYALVTGLAYNVAKKAMEDLKTFDVTEEPPPPEEQPPPPEKTDTPPPPQIVAPPPLVRTNQTSPPIISTPVAPPPQITRTAPPAPPAPPAIKRVEPKSATGDVRSLFNEGDYPAAAMDSGAEGTSRARLDIGSDGRVTNCTIVQSAGNRALDQATCSVLKRRARFTPARDGTGNPISGSITTPPIRWQLQG